MAVRNTLAAAMRSSSVSRTRMSVVIGFSVVGQRVLASGALPLAATRRESAGRVQVSKT